MNVSLTPHLEEFVKAKVESGLYNSSSEVVREALRLLEEQDRLRQIRLEALRREVRIGLDQLDRGEGTPLDIEDIIRRGNERLKAKKGTE